MNDPNSFVVAASDHGDVGDVAPILRKKDQIARLNGVQWDGATGTGLGFGTGGDGVSVLGVGIGGEARAVKTSLGCLAGILVFGADMGAAVLDDVLA